MFLHLVTIFFVIFGGVTTNVHGECPWHCLCYLMETPYTVNCSGLNLEMFPPEIHSKVQWLDLKNNFIQVIPNLDKYVNLQVLELSGNRISKISLLTFKKLKELTYLDLSNNLFTDWSQINIKYVLQYLTSLKTLNVSYNSLKQFSGKDGWSAISSSPLEYLHLKSCKITQVDGRVLLNLKNLKYLDLSSNPIKWLDDLACPTLTYLDISYCDIDSMNPNALRNLPSLATLKLSGNSQFAINHGNLTSESLQNLEISHCSLTSPGVYGFPNLTYANLRGNKIVTLKDRVFVKNKLLVELDLSANEIKNVQPLAFIGARQLAFVNLSANALRGYLPWNTFSTNYNLKTLDLSINRLESVGNLSILSLENLDLSQCLIKEIQKDSLKSLPWLMHLNMSHNPLEKLPDELHSFLRVLDLSYCRLSEINNNTFTNVREMVSLNLTGNRFTNIFKTSLFYDNDRLSHIRLGDNPWICDCNSHDFKEFWEYLTHYPQKVSLTEQRDIKCMSPGTYAGKTWVAACYYVWYPVQEPASSLGLSHYGTALLIMVLTVAGIFAVIGAIKHGIKKRMKQEERQIENEREIELGNTYETRSRAYQSRQDDFVLQGAESPELRFPRSTPRGRTDSQLTQPPTYEEAVQMISASREDILNVSREDVADSRTQSEHDNLNSDSESETGEQYSIGTIDSGSGSDSDEEAAKELNASSK